MIAPCRSESLEIPDVLIRVIDSVNVAAPQSGVIKAVHFQEGELVSAGQAIVQLDLQEAEHDLRRATWAARIAETRAHNDVAVRLSRKANAVAMTDLDRAAAINEQIPGTIPRSDVEQLRLAVDKSQLEIEQAAHLRKIAQLEHEKAQAELATTQYYLERRSIPSPLDGMLVRMYKRAGEWVDEGEKVVRIVRVNRLRAEGFLPAAMATLELIDQPAHLTVPLSDQNRHAIHGRVVFVDVEADPVNAQVRIWADFDRNHPALRPGLRGSLNVERPAAEERTPPAEDLR